MSIEDTIRTLIDQHRNIAAVEAEFALLLRDNSKFHELYNDWCTDLGYSTRTGYKECIKEIFDSEDSVWDSLSEFEDQN